MGQHPRRRVGAHEGGHERRLVAHRGGARDDDPDVRVNFVGFRWNWMPDSSRATVSQKQVRFRVHLISSDGIHEVTRQVPESRAHVNLRETFPFGRCRWWVEALVPGHPPVRSAEETFVL
jgi:hypothetical protein